MVRVQIAGRLSRRGVEAVRWVFVESAPGVGASGGSPADTLARAMDGSSPWGRRSGSRQILGLLLVWALLGLGLAAVFAAAWWWLGAPLGLSPGGAR